MSRYCHQVPGEQVLQVQGATFEALETQLPLALAQIAPGRVVTALELSGSGKGGRFTVSIHHAIGTGLEPSLTNLRLFIAETPSRLSTARDQALLRAPANYVLYDTALAGASDGLPVCGLLVLIDPGGGFVNQWLHQTQWYIDADNGSDQNDGTTPSTALATHAEFARRLGPNPLVQNIIYVDILSDLDEYLELEASFLGEDAGIWYRAAPKAVVGDTCQAWTSLAGGVESALQGTTVTDFTPYEGERCTILTGNSAGRWFWIGRINSGAMADEVARVSADAWFSPPATPAMAYTRLAGGGGAMAPGDTFQIEQLYEIRGLTLRAHRLDCGGGSELNVGSFVVESLYIRDGSAVTLVNIEHSSGYGSAPRLCGCKLDTNSYIYGGTVVLHGCCCGGAGGLGHLYVRNALCVHRSCACNSIEFWECRVSCMFAILCDGDGLRYDTGTHSYEQYVESAAIWSERAGTFGVHVSVGAMLRADSANGFWGDLTDATTTAYRVNGALYYADVSDLSGLVPSGPGTDTVIGGTVKTYAQLPYVEPLNNAMLVVEP
jgi:hypothetical protein